MKTASGTTLALLAAGKYFKAELYTVTLANGNIYRYTTAQVPTVVNGFTYGTELILTRSRIEQKTGLEVQSFTLTARPRNDHPSGAVLLEGFPFLAAITARTLDAARVTMEKIFLADWENTLGGTVPWFAGRVNEPNIGRFQAEISINSDIEMLNVAMPRNVVQAGCVHTLFDAGCTLSKAAFTTGGTVSGTPTVLAFATNLTQANNYFDLGVIKFTSGPNTGLYRTIKTYLASGGSITIIRPLPSPPGAGDTFTVTPSCQKTQAACSNTNVALGPNFNNLVHFRGKPYVPVPETMYGGGVSGGGAPQTVGSQGGLPAGSQFSGGRGAGTYTN